MPSLTHPLGKLCPPLNVQLFSFSPCAFDPRVLKKAYQEQKGHCSRSHLQGDDLTCSLTLKKIYILQRSRYVQKNVTLPSRMKLSAHPCNTLNGLYLYFHFLQKSGLTFQVTLQSHLENLPKTVMIGSFSSCKGRKAVAAWVEDNDRLHSMLP